MRRAIAHLQATVFNGRAIDGQGQADAPAAADDAG
jgi:hypothetical protein